MRIPTSTCRLQLGPAFGFAAAEAVLPYLAELGITDIYASPVLKATAGSISNYDVVDPTQLDPRLGSPDDFARILRRAHDLGLGWIQDIVPNHMAFDRDNRMLMDVLEKGGKSPYRDFFDIDWEHHDESFRGRVLAPFLGCPCGEALEQGRIRLAYDDAGLSVNYFEHRFPLRLESYPTVFTRNLGPLAAEMGENNPDFVMLLGVLYLLSAFARSDAGEQFGQLDVSRRLLRDLYLRNPAIRSFVDRTIDAFNGSPGQPASFRLLEGLLNEQLYRLAFWKVATEEINYRRFFNISELIGVRVEDERVFRHVHSLVAGLARDGRISGVRIDHVDGLSDPLRYLERLRVSAGDSFVLVEKILGLDEELPGDWPVQGTTGYDFLNFVNGVFCKTDSEPAFTRMYIGLSGSVQPPERILSEKKRLIIGKHMAGEVENLAIDVRKLAAKQRFGSDITFYGLKRAIVEVLTFFPVYRTYIRGTEVSHRDRRCILDAVGKARQAMPDLAYAFSFLERFLLQQQDDLPEEERRRWLEAVMRFQQYTGALRAKGFEDTFLYVYTRLLSLNDVGGDPARFGITRREFHDFNRRRAERWPHSLNATATHDTKRGEDARARINVLSEIPHEWERTVKRWRVLNGRRRRQVGNMIVPDPNDEYFLYQTLLGHYPLDPDEREAFVERLKAYIVKAVREAKVHTEWLKADAAYEEAYSGFIGDILRAGVRNQFLDDFHAFHRRIAHHGAFNSLSQTLLKIAAPGVPDLYQGCELWDFSFVDPDNRRPVDFRRRAEILRELQRKESGGLPRLAEELLAAKSDGRAKLFLTWRALAARRRAADLFGDGAYLPLESRGAFEKHVIAFARRRGDTWAVAAAPRFTVGLVGETGAPLGPAAWRDTEIVLPPEAPSAWRDAIAGAAVSGAGALPAATVFAHFPAALLFNEGGP